MRLAAMSRAKGQPDEDHDGTKDLARLWCCLVSAVCRDGHPGEPAVSGLQLQGSRVQRVDGAGGSDETLQSSCLVVWSAYRFPSLPQTSQRHGWGLRSASTSTPPCSG